MPTAGKAYDPTYSLYKAVIALIPGAVGSGIVAAKSGYHSSRAYNEAYHPGNYSIRYSYDQQGPSDGAAAIDVTMSTSNMIKYTKIMIDAMKRKDPRVAAVKEIIGTVDGKNVVRFTRTSPDAPCEWASSDDSHLWHQHYSLFRKYINDWNALKGIVDVLKGIPLDNPIQQLGADMIGLKLGDKGQAVEGLQGILRRAGFNAPSTGVYDSGTAAAVLAARKSQGSSATDGNVVTGYAYEQITVALILNLTRREISVNMNLPAKGDRGTVVGKYQRMLKSLGYVLDVTNVYDDATVAAVKAFFWDSTGEDTDGTDITSSIDLRLYAAVLKGEKGDKGDPGEPGADGTAVVTGSVTVDLQTGEVSG